MDYWTGYAFGAATILMPILVLLGIVKMLGGRVAIVTKEQWKELK